jgi:hypothetical protein
VRWVKTRRERRDTRSRERKRGKSMFLIIYYINIIIAF